MTTLNEQEREALHAPYICDCDDWENCPRMAGTYADVEAILTARLAKVEALADEWEAWARTASTTRIDAFRDAAERLRAALASDPTHTQNGTQA